MTKTIFPEIRWAQRSHETDLAKNIVWVTICVPDLTNFDVSTTNTTFKFTGKDANRDYFVEFELYDEINSNLTREIPTSQHVVVQLHKKQPRTEYWPRLSKDTARKPYIKTDFDKWVDEDEQDPKEENPYGAPGGDMDMASMLQNLGGASGAGLEGLGGADGGNFDFSQQLDDDSSDDENDETKSDLGEAK